MIQCSKLYNTTIWLLLGRVTELCEATIVEHALWWNRGMFELEEAPIAWMDGQTAIYSPHLHGAMKLHVSRLSTDMISVRLKSYRHTKTIHVLLSNNLSNSYCQTVYHWDSYFLSRSHKASITPHQQMLSTLLPATNPQTVALVHE